MLDASPRVAVIVTGRASADAVEIARALGAPALELVDAPALESARALAREACVVWLDPWVCFDPTLVASARAWSEAAPPGAVVLAPLVLAWADGAIPLGRRVVFSAPGAAALRSGQARAVEQAALRPGDRPLRLRAPGSLAEHLAAIDEQTSLAAELADAAGERPRWSDLCARPVWSVLRGLAFARGSRRRALPRAVLEAYRSMLVAAKLWERRRVPGSLAEPSRSGVVTPTGASPGSGAVESPGAT